MLITTLWNCNFYEFSDSGTTDETDIQNFTCEDVHVLGYLITLADLHQLDTAEVFVCFNRVIFPGKPHDC